MQTPSLIDDTVFENGNAVTSNLHSRTRDLQPLDDNVSVFDRVYHKPVSADHTIRCTILAAKPYTLTRYERTLGINSVGNNNHIPVNSSIDPRLNSSISLPGPNTQLRTPSANRDNKHRNNAHHKEALSYTHNSILQYDPLSSIRKSPSYIVHQNPKNVTHFFQLLKKTYS